MVGAACRAQLHHRTVPPGRRDLPRRCGDGALTTLPSATSVFVEVLFLVRQGTAVDIHIDLGRLYSVFLAVLPMARWISWWRWAVDWNRMGPVLREGAWAPVLLVMIVAAFAWSRIAPSECACLQVVILPNFWWQLGSVLTLGLI